MPIYELRCPKCGEEYEVLMVSDGVHFCGCGEVMEKKISLIANTPEGWGRP